MSSRNLRRTLITPLLTYVFVISWFSPFAVPAKSSLPVKARPTQERTDAPHREGELLVRFRAGVSQHDKETIIAIHGARKKKDLAGESRIEKLELLTSGDVRTAALQMLLDPQVDFAEPNFLIAKDEMLPNDEQFDRQWALRNTGQNGGQFGSDINASGAWSTTTGSRSAIAVIDSGVRLHPSGSAQQPMAQCFAKREWRSTRLGLRSQQLTD